MKNAAILVILVSICSRYSLAVLPEEIHEEPPPGPPERVPGGTGPGNVEYTRPNPHIVQEFDYYRDMDASEIYGRAYYVVDHYATDIKLFWSSAEPNRAAHISYREESGLAEHIYENAEGLDCAEGGSCWYNPDDDPDGTEREERTQEVIHGLRTTALQARMDEASYLDLVDYMQPTVVTIPTQQERTVIHTLFNQVLRHAKDLLGQTGKHYTITQFDHRQTEEIEAFKSRLIIEKGPIAHGYKKPRIRTDPMSDELLNHRSQVKQSRLVNSRAPIIAIRPPGDSSHGLWSGETPQGSFPPLYAKYNLIDVVFETLNRAQRRYFVPRSIVDKPKRNIASSAAMKNLFASSDLNNSTDNESQTDINLDAWSATQDRIANTIWPMLDTITNGTNCSLVYDIAWSIWADITAADTDVIGPFSWGMTSLASNQLSNSTRISMDNTAGNYTLAVYSILWDLYQYAWYNSVQAANKTGDLQILNELGAAPISNSVIKSENSGSRSSSNFRWFTTYNQTMVPQQLGYNFTIGDRVFQ